MVRDEVKVLFAYDWIGDSVRESDRTGAIHVVLEMRLNGEMAISLPNVSRCARAWFRFATEGKSHQALIIHLIQHRPLAHY